MAEVPTGDPGSGALAPRTFKVSRDARNRLIRCADASERVQEPGGPFADLTGYASKGAEQAARLAGVLTMWRDLGATVIDASDMENGIRLALCYLREAQPSSSYTRRGGISWKRSGFGLAGGRAKPDFVTGAILPGTRSRRMRNKVGADRLLGILVEHGWVRRLSSGTVVEGVARKTAGRLASCETAKAPRAGLSW